MDNGICVLIMHEESSKHNRCQQVNLTDRCWDSTNVLLEERGMPLLLNGLQRQVITSFRRCQSLRNQVCLSRKQTRLDASCKACRQRKILARTLDVRSRAYIQESTQHTDTC